jgi:hypothetical protein
MACGSYLGVGVTVDCSRCISLTVLPVSLIISRFRRTFRVSLQCHLAATVGSRACRRLYRARAAPGSSTADGGISGSASNNSRKCVVIWESVDDSTFERGSTLLSRGAGDVSNPESWSGSTASRPGKMRCCIQYAVPPTTMGIFRTLCASSI